MELLCPAGSMQAAKSAIASGADAIYVGLRDETNARHFTGLNFSKEGLREVAQFVRRNGRRMHVAINTFAHPEKLASWRAAVDIAVDASADVLIVADIAVLDYIAQHYPHIERHLSVQASATNAAAIDFYRSNYGVSRVVLPRVLSMAQVASLARQTPVELEVFAFGSLCIMAEGRCYLSSYMTGESPNNSGACSPAKYVRWQERDGKLESRLNGILIDRFDENESAGYPTLCKGRFKVEGERYHVLEEPTSLNTLELLPQLLQEGISAVKIEGRQRSPGYVAKITRVWRDALDTLLAAPDDYAVQARWQAVLAQLSEGSQTTLGAYEREWR